MPVRARGQRQNHNKPNVSAVAVVLVLLTLLSVPFTPHPGNTANAVAFSGDVHPSSGIVVGNASLWENQTIILDGNLTVNATGRLTMHNVTLVINSTFDGQYGIFVEEGSRLSMYESTVTVWDRNSTAIVGDPADPLVVSQGFKSRFDVYGNLTVERSSIQYLWGEGAGGPSTWNGGIRIFSNDVLIRDTTVSRGEVLGLSASDVRNLRLDNVTITLCNVSGARAIRSQVELNGVVVHENGMGSSAALSFVESSFVLANSHIHSNNQTGVWSRESSGLVAGSNISGNNGSGLVTYGGTLRVEGNILEYNWAQYGIFLQRDEGSQLVGNHLAHNGGSNNWGSGIMLAASNGTHLHGNSMVDNVGAGLHTLGGCWDPIVVENTTVTGNPIGIYTEGNVAGSHIINSTVHSTQYDVKVNLNDHPASGTSNITLTNTSFDRDSVLFMDLDSYLAVHWFMHVRVLNTSDSPVPGADVEVRDTLGEITRTGMTDEDGYLKWLVVQEYLQNDTNGDHDGADPGEKEMRTPHVVTASKDGVTGQAVPLMNASRTITIVLDMELPPRAPDIRDARLTGPALEDLLLSWDLSEDDYPGGNVDHYSIYCGVQYDQEGMGYEFVAEVPAGTRIYRYERVGEGDSRNYFCYVRANDSLDGGSWNGQAGKFTRPLAAGPNLVSPPLIQSNDSIETVLQTVNYDKAWFYDSPSQEWKWFMKLKGYRKGLWNVNHTIGVWINVTQDSNLTVAGVIPAQTTIHLHTGWNLVSFPSLNNSFSVLDLKAEIGGTRVEGHDFAAHPNFLRVLGDAEVLLAGEAYWVKVDAEVDWIVEVS